MNIKTKRRLGNVSRIAQPLSATEEKVRERWFPNARVEQLHMMRLANQIGPFNLIKGGRHGVVVPAKAHGWTKRVINPTEARPNPTGPSAA